jgi:hypothetical protein
MTLVRLSFNREREFELVHFDPAAAEWSLHGQAGDLLVFDSDLAPLDFVEVKCDFCGRWSTDSAPSRDRHGMWLCFGGISECSPEPAPTQAA